jgi:hypothetical protein
MNTDPLPALPTTASGSKVQYNKLSLPKLMGKSLVSTQPWHGQVHVRWLGGGDS